MKNEKLNGRFPMWGGDPWLEPLDERERRRRRNKRLCRVRVRNFLHPWRISGWRNRVRAVLFLLPVNYRLRAPAKAKAPCIGPALGAAHSICRP